jgi:NitT/TauT family transport system ATP-binding protein
MTLEIKNLSFSYGKCPVIDDLSLILPAGSVTALIGKSGSGKTTLLKLIAGLLKPSCGSIKAPSQFSYMMQEDTLLPWRSVWDQLALIKEFQEERPQNSDRDIREMLELVGLDKSTLSYPHQLSGGMRRRVALAQAVLHNSSLLLLDEPFSSLDVHSREQLFDLLLSIREKKGTTILLVTHDYRDAVSVADRIIRLRDGKIQETWQIPDETRSDPAKTGLLIHQIRQCSTSIMGG